MKKIAIFYHTCLHLDRNHACEILIEQSNALRKSGVLTAADQIVIGLNGTPLDAALLAKQFDDVTPDIIVHDNWMWPGGEVPTLQYLHDWVDVYPDYNVLYLHMKGLSHVPKSATHEFNRDWRRTMQSIVVDRWRECVAFLESGGESAGNWWNVAPNGSYWAGNFWWATAEFIRTLPKIETAGHHSGGRYEAEVWIGRGPALPRILSL